MLEGVYTIDVIFLPTVSPREAHHCCRGSRDVPCLRIMRLRNVIDLAIIDGERNAPNDRVRNGREVES